MRLVEASSGPRLLSVEEAAHYLGISTGTMRNWLSMRRVEYVKVGRLTRISQAALDRYVFVNTVRPVNEQS
jgi:excisionase family DNA binding protein